MVYSLILIPAASLNNSFSFPVALLISCCSNAASLAKSDASTSSSSANRRHQRCCHSHGCRASSAPSPHLSRCLCAVAATVGLRSELSGSTTAYFHSMLHRSLSSSSRCICSPCSLLLPSHHHGQNCLAAVSEYK